MMKGWRSIQLMVGIRVGPEAARQAHDLHATRAHRALRNDADFGGIIVEYPDHGWRQS
jgi:hypothetical protein